MTPEEWENLFLAWSDVIPTVAPYRVYVVEAYDKNGNRIYSSRDQEVAGYFDKLYCSELGIKY